MLLTSLTPAVAAQQVSATDKETARGLMDLGRQAEANGDYQGAAKAYEGADRIMGVPSTALSLGRAQMQLGKLVAARDALLRAARYPEKPHEPKVFTEARREAQLLAESLGRRIPTLTIQIRGLPEGAEAAVTVDGEPVEAALIGLPRRIDPGTHVVSAKGTGFRDVNREVTLAEEQTETLVLTLEPDGTPLTPSPAPSSTLPEDVAPPQTGGISPWVWVGLGIGGAGIVAGSVTGGLSLSAVASAKDQCEGNACPGAAKSDADRGKVLGHISTVSFVVGGAGLVTALMAGLFLSSEDADTAAVLPLVSPEHVGVRLRF
ncbi:MAG TPA: PEGA domain-containing protein [Polyangiaceae bacterium]|nr:PEGA domain-containing protein [Polyangiaceae bacterium]